MWTAEGLLHSLSHSGYKNNCPQNKMKHLKETYNNAHITGSSNNLTGNIMSLDILKILTEGKVASYTLFKRH